MTSANEESQPVCSSSPPASESPSQTRLRHPMLCQKLVSPQPLLQMFHCVVLTLHVHYTWKTVFWCFKRLPITTINRVFRLFIRDTWELYKDSVEFRLKTDDRGWGCFPKFVHRSIKKHSVIHIVAQLRNLGVIFDIFFSLLPPPLIWHNIPHMGVCTHMYIHENPNNL